MPHRHRHTTSLLPPASCLLRALCLVAILAPPGLTFAGEPEIARFESEYPAAAKLLDARFARVRGKARMWRTSPDVPAPLAQSEASFAIDHGMEKVEISRIGPGPRPPMLGDIVYCVGEGTAFRLLRRAGEDSFRVMGIGLMPTDRAGYISSFGQFVHAHHGVMGRPMTRVLESPGFRVTSAESVIQDGKSLMRVDCEFGSRSQRDQVSLLLDPSARWLVRTCRYRPGMATSTDLTVEVEYHPTSDGPPLPRHVTYSEGRNGSQHCEFSDWSFTATPESEFTMTHYGLPDLVKANRPRNMLPYWLLGLALLLGTVALLLRWLAARRFDPAIS